MKVIQMNFFKNQNLKYYVTKRSLFINSYQKHEQNKLAEHQKKLMARHLPKKQNIKGVDKVIVVASGKGGVGKSTTAVNLAVSLSSLTSPGENVGILDIDIFGPSLPKMMGLKGEPLLNSDDDMIPLINYGIQCMSMGFLIDETSAVVWRGPMVISGVQRLLLRTAWSKVKYLVVDLPPGTGDTQLSLAQLVNVDGAVIVSTPQDIALLDVRRGVEMFNKVDIPVLGIVQNMSVFNCPKCGHQEYIFGEGGAHILAKEIGTEVIGDIALDINIRKSADDGQPSVLLYPNSPQSISYKNLAQTIIRKLDMKEK